MDELFATYSALLEGVSAWVEEKFPRGGGRVARGAHGAPCGRRRSTSCAASSRRRRSRTSGIYASGQTYEQLVLHLLAHPLAEARAYGEMLLEELQAVMPELRHARAAPGSRRTLDRVPARAANEAAAARGSRLGLDEAGDEAAAPSVRLLRAHGSEEELLAALLYEASAVGEEQALAAVARLSADGARRARPRARRRRARTAATARGAASRRSPTASRSSPTTARSATCSATACSRASGSGSRRISAPTSRTRSIEAGLGGEYERALEISRAEYERLRGEGLAEEAPYALCLAYRIRYVLELDAREALHLIELRSGREGHPSYRAVALQMRRRDRRRPPERRRRDDVRRRLDRAAPRAAALRDAQ